MGFFKDIFKRFSRKTSEEKVEVEIKSEEKEETVGDFIYDVQLSPIKKGKEKLFTDNGERLADLHPWMKEEEKRIFESTLEKDTYSIFRGIQTRKEALELGGIYSRTIRHYKKLMEDGVELSPQERYEYAQTLALLSQTRYHIKALFRDGKAKENSNAKSVK